MEVMIIRAIFSVVEALGQGPVGGPWIPIAAQLKILEFKGQARLDGFDRFADIYRGTDIYKPCHMYRYIHRGLPQGLGLGPPPH